MARKTLSSLVGRLDDDQPVEATQPAPAAPAPEQQPAEVAPAAEVTAPKKRTKYPPKVSFYQELENTDRIRGAILHTFAQEGFRNLSQFLNAAAMKEVERLERKYNDGKPFPPVRPANYPRGVRWGPELRSDTATDMSPLASDSGRCRGQGWTLADG